MDFYGKRIWICLTFGISRFLGFENFSQKISPYFLKKFFETKKVLSKISTKKEKNFMPSNEIFHILNYQKKNFQTSEKFLKMSESLKRISTR